MPLEPWKTLKSETVFKNKWWNIVREQVELPDGAVYDDMFVNDKRGGSVVFALTEDGKVVLNRQYKHGAREVVVELTVGGADEADASPLVTAQRELREETGYGEGAWEPLGVWIPNPTASRARLHAFLARGVKKVAEPQQSPREVIEASLVDPRDLPAMIAKGEIASEAAVATILTALMKLDLLTLKP